MLIGGFIPFSLIDFPGKMTCVIFSQGCFFRCKFCHNKSLVLKEHFEEKISVDEIFSFLIKRKNKLDAVTISGGEPTQQRDLKDFIKKIKNLNFLVKLDTNGTNPKMLEDLLKENLLDYIAMDIKSSFKNYEKITNCKVDISKIKNSIEIIKKSKIDYEFRTTLIDKEHSTNDILEIAKFLKNAKKYSLQTFIPQNAMDVSFQKKETISKEILKNLKSQIEKYVETCLIK